MDIIALVSFAGVQNVETKYSLLRQKLSYAQDTLTFGQQYSALTKTLQLLMIPTHFEAVRGVHF